MWNLKNAALLQIKHQDLSAWKHSEKLTRIALRGYILLIAVGNGLNNIHAKINIKLRCQLFAMLSFRLLTHNKRRCFLFEKCLHFSCLLLSFFIQIAKGRDPRPPTCSLTPPENRIPDASVLLLRSENRREQNPRIPDALFSVQTTEFPRRNE